MMNRLRIPAGMAMARHAAASPAYSSAPGMRRSGGGTRRRTVVRTTSSPVPRHVAHSISARHRRPVP
jgi:hypothetical protein